MFMVNLPVPENCYKCPLCDYEQGYCLLSGLDEKTEFNVANYANVMMLLDGRHVNLDDISRSLRIDKIEAECIIEHGGKHPNCPIKEIKTVSNEVDVVNYPVHTEKIDISKLDENKVTINGKEYELIESVPRTCEYCRYYHVTYDGRVVSGEACQWCINSGYAGEHSSLMWKRKD